MNCVYGSGSTGKIVSALYEHTKSCGDDSYVIYGMGPKEADTHVLRTTPDFIRKAQSLRSRISGYPYGGCIIGTAVALHYLKKIEPDVVHIHCINAYMVNIYRVLEYLNEHKIPTVITLHAEFMYTGGCTHTVNCNKWLSGCYNCSKINKVHPKSYLFDRTQNEWKLLQKAYSGFERLKICAVSDWVRDRARQSPFYKGYDVFTVLNGLDTNVFSYTPTEDLRKDLGIGTEKVVVHITPNFYDGIKGGQHVIEMAKRFPAVWFLIIGSDGDQSTVPQNCRFIGKISDQKLLARYYSLGDVCLLTSVRETFSMVCAESLCCGTPVVGFRSGGPELIAIEEYSEFVEYGDSDLLERTLMCCLTTNKDKCSIASEAAGKYTKRIMTHKYRELYEDVSYGSVKKIKSDVI